MPQMRAARLEAKHMGSTISFHDGGNYVAAVIEGIEKEKGRTHVYTNIADAAYTFEKDEEVTIALRNGDFFLSAMSKDLITLMRGMGIEPPAGVAIHN